MILFEVCLGNPNDKHQTCLGDGMVAILEVYSTQENGYMNQSANARIQQNLLHFDPTSSLFTVSSLLCKTESLEAYTPKSNGKMDTTFTNTVQ